MFPAPAKSLPSSFVLPITTNQPATVKQASMMHKISVLEKGNGVGKGKGKGDTPWQWIEDLLDRMSHYHEPVVDMDNDNYSGIFLLSLLYSFSLLLLHSISFVFSFLVIILILNIKMCLLWEDTHGRARIAMIWIQTTALVLNLYLTLFFYNSLTLFIYLFCIFKF